MEDEYRRRKSPLFIVGFIFIIVGIGLVIGGLIPGYITYKFQKDAKEVKATITQLGDSDNRSYNKTTVTYEVDGKQYEKRINSYSSTWYTGKRIILLYDVENPEHIKVKSLAYLVTYILSGMGLIFVILGIVFLSIVHFNKKKIAWLLEYGERCYGEITSTTYNKYVRVNNKIQLYYICTKKDDYTGKEINYRSNPLWVTPIAMNDPNFRREIERYIGEQVVIYVNPRKPKQYYVDFDVDKVMNHINL